RPLGFDPVEVARGERLATTRDNVPFPIFPPTDEQVETAPERGAKRRARRIDWKWRLIAMVELDGGERNIAIEPRLLLAGVMNDAWLQPLLRNNEFVQLKIPSFREQCDLASTNNIDARLVDETRIARRRERHNGSGELVPPPDREVHQHHARIDVVPF